MTRDVLNSHRLNCFYHVATCSSFRDAARSLGIAQSALSRHIQALEAELGMVLIHRSRGSLVLTEAGERLLARSREMLSTFEDIRNDMDGLRGHPRGVATLALPASFATAYLSRFVPTFMEACPDVRLRILEGSAIQIEELLVSGRADVAIVVASERARHLNQELLMSDELYLVGRRPLHRQGGTLRIAELVDLPLVLPLPPYGTRRLIDDVTSRHKVTLTPVLEADSPHILKQLVMTRDLYTIMPGISFAQERAAGQLHGIGLSPSLKRHLAIATVAGRATSLAARTLAQHIRIQAAHVPGDTLV